MVDLAGSESVRTTSGGTSVNTESRPTNAEDERQRALEGQAINLSLHALRQVVKVCSQPRDRRKVLPPFRDSKLTLLLRRALCGNGRTTMVLNCSQRRKDGGQTLSTLQFGSAAAKLVKTLRRRHELSVEQLRYLGQQAAGFEADVTKLASFCRECISALPGSFVPVVMTFPRRTRRQLQASPLYVLAACGMAAVADARTAIDVGYFQHVVDLFTMMRVNKGWHRAIAGCRRLWELCFFHTFPDAAGKVPRTLQAADFQRLAAERLREQRRQITAQLSSGRAAADGGAFVLFHT